MEDEARLFTASDPLVVFPTRAEAVAAADPEIGIFATSGDALFSNPEALSEIPDGGHILVAEGNNVLARNVLKNRPSLHVEMIRFRKGLDMETADRYPIPPPADAEEPGDNGEWTGNLDALAPFEGGKEEPLFSGPPEPLRGEVKTTPFPLDCLPGVARTYAEQGAASKQVCPTMMGALVLGAGGVACTGKAIVDGGGWSQPLALFLAVIAGSSERKSPAMDLAIEPIRAFDERTRVERAPEIQRARERHAAWNHELRAIARNLGNGNGVEAELIEQRESIMEEMRANPIPDPPSHAIKNTTTERMSAKLSSLRRTAQVESEMVRLMFYVRGGYGSGGRADDAFYNDGFDGAALEIHRQGHGGVPVEINKPFAYLSMLTTGQPSVAEELARDVGLEGRGFTPRLLFAYPEPMKGKRTEGEGPPMDPRVEVAYREMMDALCAVDPKPDERPPKLACSPRARAMLAAYQQQVESDSRFTYVGSAWAGKAAGKLLRIAGILHAMKHAHDPRGWVRIQITEETMEQARRIMRWFEGETIRFYGGDVEAPTKVVADATDLLEKIEGLGSTSFTKRELVRGHRRYAVPPEGPLRWEKAIRLLVSTGHVALLREHGRGHRFAVNPAMSAMSAMSAGVRGKNAEAP